MAKFNQNYFWVLTFVLIFTVAVQAVPLMINYQGMVETGGVPFDGTGLFKFAIVDAAGTTQYWSNDGNDPPVNVVVVPVDNGLYGIHLGDTSAMDGIPGSVFDNDAIYLRIWFNDGGGSGFQLLSPDQRITSAGFAIRAGTADDAGSVDGYEGADLEESSEIDSDIAAHAGIADAHHTKTTSFSNLTDQIAGTQIPVPFNLSGTITTGNYTDGPDGAIIVGENSYSSIYRNYGGYFSVLGNTGKGVYGISAGADGRGIEGHATHDGSIVHYGGFFEAEGIRGIGVYGEATHTGDDVNYGGNFIASGAHGIGAYGGSYGEFGTGVFGSVSGISASAVIGSATASGGTNHGGYFKSHGATGRAVYGEAANTNDVENYGGYFESKGNQGRGVCGFASSIDGGVSYGGYFTAANKYGVGIYADTTGSNGTGVQGFASNTGNVTNYGGKFTAFGDTGRGVYGYASSTDSGEKFGGYFESNGILGRGAYGLANGDSSIGVYGLATGANSTGVYASGVLWDVYAAGNNYGPFTGAHEVKFTGLDSRRITPGLIVSVTGAAEIRTDIDGKISLSSTLPTVKISDKPRDKAVFGVITSECTLPLDHWYEPTDGERFGVVNSLGDGRVWVTDLNGDIEAGDYITTSSLPGYGQRQDDDLLHSYTLGKAIETIDWESVSETVEFKGRLVRVYLVAVAYVSG